MDDARMHRISQAAAEVARGSTRTTDHGLQNDAARVGAHLADRRNLGPNVLDPPIQRRDARWRADREEYPIGSRGVLETRREQSDCPACKRGVLPLYSRAHVCSQLPVVVTDNRLEEAIQIP